MMEVETHPWLPFIPDGARILIMGTFPPGEHRWSMEFYYPNRTNDFWYMMGLIFYGNRTALVDSETKKFRLERIKDLLTERKIALGDTCRKIIRLKGNASDKFLKVIEPITLRDVLTRMPDCHTLATTGEKAAGVIAELTETEIPKTGTYVRSDCGLNIWRMPSTSRAYPLALEKKADYYRKMFETVGIL